MSELGICRLCLNKAELRNSHIIPEFLWTRTDSQHRVNEYRSDSERTPWIQKGLREHLLCDTCEGRLQKLELYFSLLWYGPATPLPEKISTINNTLTLTSIDYDRSKLFLLSILWRCGVAERAEYAGVQLGARHLEKLRRMILESRAGSEVDYPIFAALLYWENDHSVFHQGVVAPQRYRVDGNITWISIFGGCAWNFMMSCVPGEETRRIDSVRLRPGGTFTLAPMPAAQALRRFITARRRFVASRSGSPGS